MPKDTPYVYNANSDTYDYQRVIEHQRTVDAERKQKLLLIRRLSDIALRDGLSIHSLYQELIAAGKQEAERIENEALELENRALRLRESIKFYSSI